MPFLSADDQLKMVIRISVKIYDHVAFPLSAHNRLAAFFEPAVAQNLIRDKKKEYDSHNAACSDADPPDIQQQDIAVSHSCLGGAMGQKGTKPRQNGAGCAGILRLAVLFGNRVLYNGDIRSFTLRLNTHA